ncbi:MAG: type II toxin-antitoxin system prevent-host-death family antitoxin [Deltaproteobacteria bacterium]|nr:type II toxin-antitoxin system prevent-host-death family antitoxin [Deltaproteobacteria bacterium]
MKSTNIAELKAHLAQYLRSVQNGEEVVVLDRKTPIAKVIPWKGEKGTRLWTRKPTHDPLTLSALWKSNGKEVSRYDSLSFLLETRKER